MEGSAQLLPYVQVVDPAKQPGYKSEDDTNTNGF
jgi:hypothetical protein